MLKILYYTVLFVMLKISCFPCYQTCTQVSHSPITQLHDDTQHTTHMLEQDDLVFGHPNETKQVECWIIFMIVSLPIFRVYIGHRKKKIWGFSKS